MVAYSAGAVWRRALFRPLTYGAVLFLSGILSLFSTAAFAACSSPSGVAGDLIWDNTANAPSYCNDTDWVAFPVGSAPPWETSVLRRVLRNPLPDAGDEYGVGVAVFGDLAVVGARYDSPGGISKVGAAYVFNIETGALLATLSNPDPQADDNFGFTVALSGGLAVVGTPYDDPGGVTNAGSVYVFNATTGALVSTLTNPAPTVSDFFGFRVAIAGNTAVVSAHGDASAGPANAGVAYVFNATTGALVATLNNPDPTLADVFGYSVAVSGSVVAVGAHQNDPGGVQNAGSAYLFSATTGSLLRTIDNPNPVTNDFFGYHVHLDGARLAVGAYAADPEGASSAGIAYVFDVPTGALVSTLNNPDPTVDDYFGVVVSVSGPFVLTSAYRDDPGGISNAGTAYVFDAETGDLVHTLSNPAPATDDFFGWNVSLQGSAAIIGAPGDNPDGLAKVGAAYVFGPDVSAWKNPQVMTQIDNPQPEADDRFGVSADVSGGLVIAGAYQDNPGGVDNAGAAYVFNRMTGALVSTLNNPTPAVSDVFGWEVALDGNTAVVGANQDDPGGVVDAGSAYIFDATTGALLFTLDNPAPQMTDVFGINVRIDGNLVAVAATLDNPGGVNDAGSAYVFNATNGTLVATIPNPAPAAADRFAGGLDISGNVLAVGAYWDDPGGVSDAGTAYVFNATTGALVTTLNNPAPDSGDEFGYEVKIDGDLVAVGAWHDDPGGVSDAGTAYVFDATTGALVSTLVNPDPEASDHFGARLSIDGTTVFVAAHVKDVGGFVDAGVVYVFDANSGALLETIENPDPGTSDSFGRALSADGGAAVIGALGNQVGSALVAGSVYTYAPSCAGPGGFVGDITYNTTSHVLQYCAGGDWVGAGPAGDGGAGCASPAGVEGDLMYNSDHNYLQYCEGDTWRGIGF